MNWWQGLVILFGMTVLFSLFLPLLGESIGNRKGQDTRLKTLRVVLHALEVVELVASFLVLHFWVFHGHLAWLSVLLSFVSFFVMILFGMLFTHLREEKG